MGLWDGTTLWDGSTNWGFTDVSPEVEVERELFGKNGTVKRFSVFEIFSVDEETLAVGEVLGLRSVGGKRDVNGKTRVAQETLEFKLDDPTLRYWPGGDLYYLVDPNSLVGVRWTVNSDNETETIYGGVFRVDDNPDLNRKSESGVPEPSMIHALDWLRRPLERPAFYEGGQTPLRDSIFLKEDMLALGSPVIGHEDSWATVAAAIIYYLSNHHLRVTGDWRSPLHPSLENLNDLVDPLTTDALAVPPNWGKVFDFVAGLSRSRAVYDPDGWLRMMEDINGVDSGLVVSCPETPGRLDVPWESMERNIEQAEFTEFQYWITWIQESGSPPVIGKYNMPVFGEAAGTPQINGVPIVAIFSQPIVHLEFVAKATSNAMMNPHIDDFTKVRVQIDKANYSFNIADQTAQEYCQSILHKVLAEADTLKIKCDNSFPASRNIGANIYINVPDEGVVGWFTLNQINQPLDQNSMTLILNWFAD